MIHLPTLEIQHELILDQLIPYSLIIQVGITITYTSSTTNNNSGSNDQSQNLENNLSAYKTKKKFSRRNLFQPASCDQPQPALSVQPAQEDVGKITSSGYNFLVKGFKEEEKAIIVKLKINSETKLLYNKLNTVS